jgi:hypothetical protein
MRFRWRRGGCLCRRPCNHCGGVSQAPSFLEGILTLWRNGMVVIVVYLDERMSAD